MRNPLWMRRILPRATMVRSSMGVYYTVAALASSCCHSFQPSPALGRHYLFHQSTRCFSASRTPEEVEMTRDALAIVQQAIQAVDPSNAVQQYMRVDPMTGVLQIEEHQYHAGDYDNVLLLAFGKASSAMATACVQQLQQHDTWTGIPMKGVVIVKDDHGTEEEYKVLQTSGIEIQPASHPVPDQRSVDGARRIIQLAQEEATVRTLVMCCISGGGSSLFCEPQPPLSLEALQQTNSVLLASGLSITDMNVIRKRLETGKGGKLAVAVHPATLVTLILSDILGDPLDLIASGPTVPDQSTPQDAWRLIQSNPVIRNGLPRDVLDLIQEQVEEDNGPLDASHAVFEKAATVLVGNNELAVVAAADEAKRRGYNPVILGTRMEGEAQHVAGVYTAMAQHIGGDYSMAQRPAALIAGGETTVTLPPNNSGKGGRNQELALAAAMQLQDMGLRNVVLASVGTDGTDGPTDAAGAVVDGGTVQRLPGSAEEALQQHNAYAYLQQVEEGEDEHCPLIKTGPTGTNVADVCVTLIR